MKPAAYPAKAMASRGWWQQDVAGLGGSSVAEELEQALGVDGVVPAVAFGLEAVGGELDEEDAGAGIVGEVAVEGEVVGDGEDGVGDGDVAGLEAGVALDDGGVDAGHGGGVAVDEDVAGAVVDVEDGVVGLDPDAGSVAEEEVGVAEADAGRDDDEGEEEEDQAVAEGGAGGREGRGMGRAGRVGVIFGEDGARGQVAYCNHGFVGLWNEALYRMTILKFYQIKNATFA